MFTVMFNDKKTTGKLAKLRKKKSKQQQGAAQPSEH